MLHYIVGLVLKIRISILMEAIQAFLAFGLFCFAAFLSMYYAEHDPHLKDLSNREEWEHTFFRNCRLQSLFSLGTGFMFLVHATLMTDILLVKDDDLLR